MNSKCSFLLFLLLTACLLVNAQQVPATLIAKKIADRITDSLALSEQQRAALYAINMQLHDRKMLLRQQYSSPDSLRYYLQAAENSRDSLYLPVLGKEKFALYLRKKRNLVNNN